MSRFATALSILFLSIADANGQEGHLRGRNITAVSDIVATNGQEGHLRGRNLDANLEDRVWVYPYVGGPTALSVSWGRDDGTWDPRDVCGKNHIDKDRMSWVRDSSSNIYMYIGDEGERQIYDCSSWFNNIDYVNSDRGSNVDLAIKGTFDIAWYGYWYRCEDVRFGVNRLALGAAEKIMGQVGANSGELNCIDEWNTQVKIKISGGSIAATNDRFSISNEVHTVGELGCGDTGMDCLPIEGRAHAGPIESHKPDQEAFDVAQFSGQLLGAVVEIGIGAIGGPVGIAASFVFSAVSLLYDGLLNIQDTDAKGEFYKQLDKHIGREFLVRDIENNKRDIEVNTQRCGQELDLYNQDLEMGNPDLAMTRTEAANFFCKLASGEGLSALDSQPYLMPHLVPTVITHVAVLAERIFQGWETNSNAVRNVLKDYQNLFSEDMFDMWKEQRVGNVTLANPTYDYEGPASNTWCRLRVNIQDTFLGELIAAPVIEEVYYTARYIGWSCESSSHNADYLQMNHQNLWKRHWDRHMYNQEQIFKAPLYAATKPMLTLNYLIAVLDGEGTKQTGYTRWDGGSKQYTAQLTWSRFSDTSYVDVEKYVSGACHQWKARDATGTNQCLNFANRCGFQQVVWDESKDQACHYIEKRKVDQLLPWKVIYDSQSATMYELHEEKRVWHGNSCSQQADCSGGYCFKGAFEVFGTCYDGEAGDPCKVHDDCISCQCKVNFGAGVAGTCGEPV